MMARNCSFGALICQFVVLLCCCTANAVDNVFKVPSYTVNVFAHYPESNLRSSDKMYLRGDSFDMNWNSGQEMTLIESNTWYIKLSGSKESGSMASFKTLVNDKTWMIGCNAMFNFTSDTSNNVTIDIYPWFYTNSGKYKVIPNIYSSQLRNVRDLIVYTPPSYYENTLKQYKNVLIMHDGENLFNASTSFEGVAWDVQDTINEQVVEGNIEEVFVIGIYNTAARIYEYDYSYDVGILDGGGADYYLDFIVETAIPKVRSLYSGRIPDDLTKYGMVGSSLGGILTCYTGWTRGDTFNKVGCMSSSFWWNNYDFNSTILLKNYQNRPDKIYLDVGSSEGTQMISGAIYVRNSLQSLGYVLNDNLYYYLDPLGQHNEYYWGKRFYIPMQFMYSPNATVLT